MRNPGFDTSNIQIYIQHLLSGVLAQKQSFNYLNQEFGDVFVFLWQLYLAQEYNEVETQYTSKNFDPDIGLYYYNARWYDPELGRFITEDPARANSNWYIYASNNPIMRIDPSGLDDYEIPLGPGTKFDTRYGTMVDAMEPTLISELEYSNLSQSVYNDPGFELHAGWRKFTNAELEEMGIDPELLQDETSGFYAGLFQREDGQVVLSFRGTNDDPLDLNSPDMVANISQGKGLDSDQHRRARTLSLLVAENFGDARLSFTGHSLGGGLAATSAIWVNSTQNRNTTAMTFNSAGVHPNTVGGEQNLGSASRFVTNYRVTAGPKAEILTGLQEHFTFTHEDMPDAVGVQKNLEISSFYTWNLGWALDAHNFGRINEGIMNLYRGEYVW